MSLADEGIPKGHSVSQSDCQTVETVDTKEMKISPGISAGEGACLLERDFTGF